MADEHPIDLYKKAMAKRSQAEAKVKDVVERVFDVAAKLQDWKKVGIQDNHKILSNDPLTTPGARVLIEAADWPSVRDFHFAREEYQKAHNEAKGAYQALSHEDQALVGPFGE